MGLLGDVFDIITSPIKRNQQKADARHAEDVQREFAQSGVQWRVKDAQEAGVHPLFALGASVPGFSPSQIEGTNFEGIGNAISNIEDSSQKASRNTQQDAVIKAQLEAAAAAAERDKAHADLFRAQAAKERQVPVSPWPELATDQDTYHEFGDKAQVYNPYSDAIVRRANPELMGLTIEERPLPYTRGLHDRPGLDNPDSPQPGWSAYEFGDGPIVLPYNPKGSSLMEALEGMGAKETAAVIAENRRRFGNEGVKRIMKLVDPRTGAKSFKDYKGKSSADSFQQMPAW